MKHVGVRTDVADIASQEQVAEVSARIQPLMNMTSCTTAGAFSGSYYDNSFWAGAGATIAGTAARMDVSPYFSGFDFYIDRIGVVVTTAVASAQAKVVIYATDVSTGSPAALLYESAALDCSSTGLKEVVVDFMFAAGIQYWIGARHSSTATLRAVPLTSCKCIGLPAGSSTASTYATVLRTSVAFATAAPSPWSGFSAVQLTSATPVSVRFRAL